MQRKLFKTGNSLVVALPREAIDLLGAKLGSELSIELDSRHQRVTLTHVPDPLAEAGVDEAFARQIQEFINQYRPALEQLAK